MTIPLSENNLFRGDNELLRFLRRTAVPRGGSVVMVAGQFALALDESRERLIPVLGKEPERSFALAARFLHSCAVSSSAQAHLLLLVDDRRFRAPPLLPAGTEMSPERAVNLRRRYFGGPRPIPHTFLKILRTEGLHRSDALLPRGSPELPASTIMPADSLLFSSQELCDRYLECSLPVLLQEVAAGRLEPTAEAESRPGDMVHLIGDLARRGITDIIFMIPDSPPPHLDRGLSVGLYLAERLVSGPPVLHLVTNMDRTEGVGQLIMVSTYRADPVHRYPATADSPGAHHCLPAIPPRG